MVGHSYRRVGVNGKPRYAAIYHDARGQRRSAGTYATKREADRAWAAAEADALLGRGRDPRSGKITFDSYVTGVWLPNHQLEHTTRQRYSYQLSKYLLPEFGAMRMGDIAPVHASWYAAVRNTRPRKAGAPHDTLHAWRLREMVRLSTITRGGAILVRRRAAWEALSG
jgi:hypothetical protein